MVLTALVFLTGLVIVLLLKLYQLESRLMDLEDQQDADRQYNAHVELRLDRKTRVLWEHPRDRPYREGELGGATEKQAPDRRHRLSVPIKVGSTAILSRDGASVVLTVVRSDAGKGAEVTVGNHAVWLPVRQIRSVYFAETRVGLSVHRAFTDGIRLSIEAPLSIHVRRPHADGMCRETDDLYSSQRNAQK